MSNDELYLAAGRAYCLKLFDYEPSAYVDETARLRHIENDATSTAVEPWLRAAVDAVVAALAGRLLPPGGKKRIEWGRRYASGIVRPCNPSEASQCATQPEEHVIREIVEWSHLDPAEDEWPRYTGPWCEVSP